MKTTIKLTYLAVLGLLFAAPLAGQAAPIIQVDFDSMTAGNPVVVAGYPLAGGQLTAATTASGAGSDNIVNGFQAMTGNVLDLVKPTAGSTPVLVKFQNYKNPLATGTVSLSFNLTIDNYANRNGNFFVGVLNSEFNGVSGFTLGMATNNNLSLNAYTAGALGTTSYASSLTVGTLAVNTNYAIEMRFDFVSGLTQTYVNGSAFGGTQPFAASSYGITGVTFSTSGGSVGQWGVDNIVVQAVPEPSALFLLLGFGLVGGMLLVRRRRSRC